MGSEEGPAVIPDEEAVGDASGFADEP